jgi:hypothetical protein
MLLFSHSFNDQLPERPGKDHSRRASKRRRRLAREVQTKDLERSTNLHLRSALSTGRHRRSRSKVGKQPLKHKYDEAGTSHHKVLIDDKNPMEKVPEQSKTCWGPLLEEVEDEEFILYRKNLHLYHSRAIYMTNT